MTSLYTGGLWVKTPVILTTKKAGGGGNRQEHPSLNVNSISQIENGKPNTKYVDRGFVLAVLEENADFPALKSVIGIDLVQLTLLAVGKMRAAAEGGGML